MEEKLKQIVCKTIDEHQNDLHSISKDIWSHPELGYKEVYAHQRLSSYLEQKGFAVKKQFPLETSFVARYGDPAGLKIGVICEFDALPGVDHACGHNLIAESGIAAGLALQAVIASSSSSIKAEVLVYGTPAEEGGGGKCKMIDAKVFDELDLCMMVHPSPYEVPDAIILARTTMRIVYTGRPSHAAAAPWEGINAVDAAVACYNNVSMLRQQMKPTCRFHGIFEEGGDRPNIIPKRAALLFYIRATDDKDCLELRERVEKCARGAAMATGCSVEITEPDPFYSAVFINKTLLNLYIHNAKTLGVPFNDAHVRPSLLVSTDMGNISQIKPSIHPMYKIATEGANHTEEFTHSVNQPENQLPTLNAAKSMAMSAVDVLCKPDLMAQINDDFKSGSYE